MPLSAPFEWWPDSVDGPFRVFVHTETLRGRLEVVGITITSAHGSSLQSSIEMYADASDSAATEPTKLTSEVLRGPLGAVIERLRSRIIQQSAGEEGDQPEGADNIVLSLETPELEFFADDASVLEEDVPRATSHARIPQALIAQAYKEAHALSSSPTLAVSKRFGISYDSAASRVMRARKAGLLPPTQRGSAASTDDSRGED